MEHLGANFIKSSKNLLNKSQMNDSTNNESSYHVIIQFIDLKYCIYQIIN